MKSCERTRESFGSLATSQHTRREWPIAAGDRGGQRESRGGNKTHRQHKVKENLVLKLSKLVMTPQNLV